MGNFAEKLNLGNRVRPPASAIPSSSCIEHTVILFFLLSEKQNKTKTKAK